MLFRIGDTVKIKSLDWYNLELDKCKYKYHKYIFMEEAGAIRFDGTEVLFAREMCEFCGKSATIFDYVRDKHDKIIGYHVIIDDKINDYTWANEMLLSIREIRNMKLKEIKVKSY